MWSLIAYLRRKKTNGVVKVKPPQLDSGEHTALMVSIEEWGAALDELSNVQVGPTNGEDRRAYRA